MPSAPTVPPAYALPARPARGRGRLPRWRQALPWASLIALVLVLQALLIWLTVRYEHARTQEQVDQVANAVAADATARVAQDVQRVQALLWNPQGLAQWRTDAADLLRQQPELLRLEWRGPQGKVEAALDSPFQAPLFGHTPRESVQQEADLACVAAARLQAPALSRSYFVPLTGGRGLEVVDVCVPMDTPGPAGLGRGSVVLATMALGQVLERVASPAVLHRHELSFLEGDGTRLVRAGSVRGSGVYVARRVVDLPGLSITLQVDSAAGSPQLIPNLSTALVMGLSLALFGVMALLVRDVRMRAATERRLAESLALRKAMEDSLTTGLRARDLHGRITYVNPAFCRMVGLRPEDLIGLSTPPYWPPELVDTYRERQVQRLKDGGPPREGYETTFMRANGERFPVVIYEAPLVDADGQHTGWMSTALDVSEQRKVEELSRQQHDKLQATARLATVGEMASLLSHELNQPLSAIASYATGSLNLFGPPEPDAHTLGMIHQAVERIAEQAQRAGRVIKSVHNFIRRRELSRESLRVDHLFDTVLPLVRMQARKCGAQVQTELPTPCPFVHCDRTMVEQVLLNLTRNALQAMDQPEIPLERRVLTLAAALDPTLPQRVLIRVRDAGAGIPEEVARQLFTPFFTTKAEGMGLGLSLCRTVAEQHGGSLAHETLFDAARRPIGTEFRFTLALAATHPPEAPP